MDPNEMLRQLRAMVGKVLRDSESDDGNDVHQNDAVAFAEKFNDLDEWISRKGFLPQDWAPASPSGTSRARGGRP
jgi:hypothetical protein